MAAKTKTVKAPAADAAAPETQVKAPLRIKDLVERLEAKSKLKKKDLREVADLVLAEVGGALAAGDGVSLPGLGHVKVMRTAANGAMTLRLRKVEPKDGQKKGNKDAEAASEALADAGEAE